MGLQLNAVMWCDSVSPIKEYVRAGQGVGLFSGGSAEAGKMATIVKRLPKTRSAKVLRGTTKKIAAGNEYRIPPTIDDDPVILNDSQRIWRC